jgi:NAD(P)-dependent dehydrogenase (short-subunit alcohol dehydrogenase family)
MIAEQRNPASAANGAGGKRFAGQSAIVTGAASGLGLGIAKRLFREGAQVSLWDCNPAALDSAAACLGGAHAVTVDVVDPAAVERATQNTVDALGRIEILVASAGITGPNAPAWEYPLSEWSRVMQVNLDGLFYSNRAVVPHFRVRVQREQSGSHCIYEIAWQGTRRNGHSGELHRARRGADPAFRSDDRDPHSIYAVQNSHEAPGHYR